MISVIIGAYNGERFLDKCIQSILRQTIDPEKMEIIIVDDASNDGTVELLRKYEEKYPNRIMLVLNEYNSSISKQNGRNIGVEYANGDYIMFLDQDDWYRDDAFEKLHKMMDENPELDYIEYDFLKVSYEGDGIDSEEQGSGVLYKCYIKDENQRKVFFEKGILPGAAYVWTKIYRKKFLEEMNIKHNDGEIRAGYSDNFFSGLVVTNCRSFGKLCEKFYFYRVYDGSYSCTSKWNDMRQFERCKTGVFFAEECERRGMQLQKNEVVEYMFLRIFLLKTFARFLLTFKPIPYEIFAFMQDEIRRRCPNCKNNSIVKSNINLYRVVELLDYDWTPTFLESLKIMVLEESEKR